MYSLPPYNDKKKDLRTLPDYVIVSPPRFLPDFCIPCTSNGSSRYY